ncbi:MAG TPA: chitinase N-terminal domain-containing protein [Dyella sp.]|uniref:chitinase N-terminal domain-containing protein n=1 Tax=Dyella sp. TaxID=1869338 RepID=UPI002F9358C0
MARRRLFAAVLMSIPGLSEAQNVSPEDELKQKIKIIEEIQPLGENPFGEKISLYSGALSFIQTDVSLSGQGPLLEITRSFKIPDLSLSQFYQETAINALVDWSLNIPHIETLSAPSYWQGSTRGQWTFIDDQRRCSGFGPAPHIAVPTKPGQEPVDWEPEAWWHGYQLVTADGESQDLLWRSASNTQAPQMGMPFPIVTRQFWSIGCLGQTANGHPGEGFLAVDPNGNKYWFDWLTYREAPTMARAGGGALVRRKALMMVSRIEDRFGNHLRYSYDAQGNLIGIEGSDGRKVSLAYESWQRSHADGVAAPSAFRLSTVTVQPGSVAQRVWRYGYSADPMVPRLNTVHQPDQSAWSFDLGAFQSPGKDSLLIYTTGCAAVWHESGQATSGRMTHPSGLSGTFTVQSLLRGRSYTPDACVNVGASGKRTFTPPYYGVAAIVRREYSGSGIGQQTWSYSYSPHHGSAIEQCGGGCADTVWTDVVDPSGAAARYTFSNRFDATESLLLRTDQFKGGIGSEALRSETYTYAASTGGPWPESLGRSEQNYLNAMQMTSLSPMRQRVIRQEGDDYVWLADSFDAFARPVQTRRYSTIAGQAILHERQTLLDDYSRWVLGLPVQSDNLTTGETVSRNEYNAANMTLARRWSFGKPVMSYTFDEQGQLSSFTDGNGRTTGLGDYRRGTPQVISYPDGTSQRLSIDEFGQIGTITDQAGATTTYSYDGMGRLAAIHYPTGDDVAWATKNIAYEFIGSDRGIAGSHWRRTIWHGDKKDVSHFDAMLRPILNTTSRADGTLAISSRTDYDWRGRTAFQSYPVDGVPDHAVIGGGTRTEFDALGRAVLQRQTSEHGDLITRNEYLQGARRLTQDPKGHVTTTAYQVFDQPSLDTVVAVSAPEGIEQQIERDLHGHPLSIRQSGDKAIVKTLIYDAHKQLCRSVEPESGSVVQAHDAAGNIAWRAEGLSIEGGDCGQDKVADAAKTHFSYDAMNRVTSIAYPAGTSADLFTYDAAGRTETTTSGTAQWTYRYNKRGLPTAEVLTVDGYQWVFGYGYDAHASLSTVLYPSNKVVEYAPDALGRPTQAGTYARDIAYLPQGIVQYMRLGSGIEYLVQSNARGLPNHFSYNKVAAPQVAEDLAYDVNANITQVIDFNGRRSRNLGYDALNRLTTASAPGLWGNETYAYDAYNNLIGIGGDRSTSYHYDTNHRLASITRGAVDHRFRYDERGNLIEKNGISLSFDQANRLTRIEGFAGYAYDAAGRRVKKQTEQGRTVYYAYGQNGRLMYRYDPATLMGTDYVYLGKQLIASREGSVSQVVGHVANVTGGSGAYVLNGWACSVGLPQSISVQVYTGGGAGIGVELGTFAANQASEETVAAQCKTHGTTYRYAIPVKSEWIAQYPGAALFVHGISPVGNEHRLLAGSGQVHLPGEERVPEPPASISVPGGSTGSVTISWPHGFDTTGYMLEQSMDGGDWLPIYSGQALSWTALLAVTGSYVYRVKGCNAMGCGTYRQSQAVAVTIVPTIAPAVSAPGTSSNGSYTVAWQGIHGAATYILQEQVNGGGWNTVQANGAGSWGAGDRPTATYGYRVQACNAAGCGPWSGTHNVVVTRIPPAPAVTQPASGQIQAQRFPYILPVSWQSSAGATLYQVRFDSTNHACDTAANACNFSITRAGDYVIRVQACNGSGCSPATQKIVTIFKRGDVPI